jgi:hypothetical protein
MGTLAISIDMPRSGDLETSGDGNSPNVLVTVDMDGVIHRLQDMQAIHRTPAPAKQSGTLPPSKQSRGSLRTWALSTAERAVFTFAASFFSALILGGSFSIPATDAALFAGASAALSVATAAIRSLSPPTEDKALDVVTRVGLTLLQAFTAAFVTSTAGATHFTDWRAGALAGAAAAFTALKSTLAVQLTGKNADRPTPASLARLR